MAANGDIKSSTSTNSSNNAANVKMKNEQIIGSFNQLRQEQRALSGKIVELEADANEHGLVLDALKDVDGKRKCFRLIGGILVERTVQEVTPSLDKNKQMLTQLVDQLKQQVVNKGEEINQFMAKHNIQIRQGPQADQPVEEESEKSSGVLVGSSPASM